VNAKNDEGLTPLQIAASFGKTEMVKYLVNQGAKVDCVDKKKQSALFLAVYHDHPKTVEALTKAGADVNLKNKKGETPLLMAAYYGFDDVFPILLAAGSDPNTKNENGRTYLEEFKKDYSN
jgi:ankyrin repeat protein